MVTRELIADIQKMAKKMPVISITGPRQSGKTILSQSAFPEYPYLNLERPEIRELAMRDPRALLEEHSDGVIVDEAQYAPKLFSYVQVQTDADRKPGRFILTGSQNFLLMEKISQSLAGRTAIYHLLPFSISELQSAGLLAPDYESQILKGFYPRIYNAGLEPARFHSWYQQTYLDRDARQLQNIKDLRTFQMFIRLCAGRIGQTLNYATLSNDAGIDVKTVKQWLSVLETSFIIFLLQPYHRNYRKRLVKSPKLYFHDTGLACYLLGIETREQLVTHHHKGFLFENFVIAELRKRAFNKGATPEVAYWRDNTGHEIDCILERAGKPIAIETKAGKTFNSDMLSGLTWFGDIAEIPESQRFLVYGGEETFPLKEGTALPWHGLLKI